MNTRIEGKEPQKVLRGTSRGGASISNTRQISTSLSNTISRQPAKIEEKAPQKASSSQQKSPPKNPEGEKEIKRTERGGARGSRGVGRAVRGTRGTTTTRGSIRQRRAPRASNTRRDRLERIKNETSNREREGGRSRGRMGVRRGRRGNGMNNNGGRGYYWGGFRRRRFGLRSIFIAGLPNFINNFKLFRLLRNDGRLLRCNVLKNRFGASRGIAFAEYQNPRDAYNAIKKWNGKNISNYSIYVAFKKNPPATRRFTNGRFGNTNNNNNRGYNRPQSNKGFGGGFGGGYNKPPVGGGRNFRGMRAMRTFPRGNRGGRGSVRGTGIRGSGNGGN